MALKNIIADFRKALPGLYAVMDTDELISLEDFIARKMEEGFDAGVTYEGSKHYEDENSDGALEEFRRDPTEPNFEKWLEQTYGKTKRPSRRVSRRSRRD